MGSRFFRALLVCAVTSCALLLLNGSPSLSALGNAGSMNALDAALTESFDVLATAGTGNAWTDNSTIPGWYASRASYNAGTGSSNTGALYSFGASSGPLVSDRALGSVGSGGTGTIYWAVRLTNHTNATITSLDVSYVGEQWRMGGSSGSPAPPSTAQTVDFQYQVADPGGVSAANSPSTGWSDFNPLDFTSPVFGPTTAAALDGNAAANRVALAATLTVTILPGQEIWLRWQDIDHPNNDHGLAIDDFSVTPHGSGAADTPPGVSATFPVNDATDVSIASDVVITFTEPVTAASGAFSFVCDSAAQAFQAGVSADHTTFTLDPDAALPAGAHCIVSVTASRITDADGVPPDQMAADYAFSFSTPAPDVPPVVAATTPADNASAVSLTTHIVVTFSEVVAASPTAFNVECPAGSPIGVTASASPASSYTLTPNGALPAATVCTVTVSANQIADVDLPADAMPSNYSFSFATANAPPPGVGNVVINEVDADTPGTDSAEFVELYDGGAGNTPLDGLVLVFYNGNGDVSYAAFDLAGRHTSASGYFTIGNPGVANVDMVFDPGAAGLLQNGADAVALYADDISHFPTGTPVTTANLQDAFVYGTDDPDDAGLLVLLNADQPQVNENGGGDGQNQSSQRCPNGSGGALNTSTYAQAAPTPGVANVCTPAPTPQNSPIVISQVYGGGGNAAAAYQNDFVELYNRTPQAVSLDGWSLQYASASGSGWETNRQPLGGTIGGGEYYLIALGSNGTVGATLPAANIAGQINLSATNGKIALADTFDALAGNCPIVTSTHVKDFVGYGSADCREGLSTAPSPGNNATSLFRLGGGATDTNENGNDFVKGAPDPRRTAPIVELGPLVLATDPRSNGVNAPRDATIEVSFTEPVDVFDPWFSIVCTASGLHADATTAASNGGRDHYITPNGNFTPGEACTVTIAGSQVVDQDTDDSGPNTDHLPGDYSWSFTVATGAAPPYPASVHLTMGNPSGAAGSDPDNYLMAKPEYALSYNRDLGRPNWVSWHLTPEWFGTLTRFDTFRPDPQVPPDWYRVQSFDFQGSGFDRGHMTPNADRDLETSIPINQATYLMSNMVAQAPDNNQGPWAAFEGYLRTLAGSDRANPASEIYIVAGPAGSGGTGSNGGVTTTLADGHVTVPAWTWKIALVLPYGSDDVARVTCSTQTIAVLMPNTQGIRNNDWTAYLTTIDAIEALTGYDFFSNVPAPIQYCIEAGVNGNNPRNPQTITLEPVPGHIFGDADFAPAATASSGLPVTIAVTSGPAEIVNGLVHLTGSGTVTLTASQAGDDTYARADDTVVSFDVARATPSFSSLSSPSIEMGTALTPVSGVIAANGAVPAGAVTIAIGAASTTAAIGADGAFSGSLATAALAAAQSPYVITFAFAGNANFTSATATSPLTVTDTTAPAIGAITASPNVVSVPNHRLFGVFVDYTTADLSGAPVCGLSVTSNEPVDGTGDGDTAPDWILADAHHLQLRAERAGTGSGRIYTITTTCTDASGNAASKSTTVAVPK